MQKILIDADTGIDDSIAILFALKQPDVRVVGVTTGCGNTSAAQAAENTLRLIRLANAPYEVPVAVGASKPLVGEWSGPVPHIHGQNGIGGVELPETPQKPLDEQACDFIIRMVRANPHTLTLVTLGRMTNLALALQKAPDIVPLVKNVVFMGGTLHSPGNVSPVCEANMAGDPEAADLVFRSGLDLTMVGLDVTTRTRLTARHLDMLERYATEENRPIASYIRQAMVLYYRFNRWQNNCLDDCPLHDPLAMLVAVDPSLVTVQKVPARVECGGTFCRGMVVADFREYPMDAPYVAICTGVDADKALGRLIAAFTREPSIL